MTYEASLPGLRILIVDDDRAIRALVQRLATEWGYETHEAATAEQALATLVNNRFNIVITDIKMGKMDGMVFAERVRTTMPSTAVIIMTGFPSAKTVQKSQNMGAVYYLKKPIGADELGETFKIAASWNLGLLIDRAAKRFVSLRKTGQGDQVEFAKLIKKTIRRELVNGAMTAALREFVYAASIENNILFTLLDKKFPGG